MRSGTEFSADNAMRMDGNGKARQMGANVRALHSIRTRWSLLTAFFLLTALVVFYIGGRVVLENLVRDAAELVLENGHDAPVRFAGVMRTAVECLAFYIAGAGIFFVLAIFWFQSRVLLNPLSRMTAAVAELGRSAAGTDCPRLLWKGKDEFALLADSVNRMLETISQRTISVAQTEARHQALIDCLPDALAIFDPEGRLVAMTKEAEGVPRVPGIRPGERPDESVFGQKPVENFLRTLRETFASGRVGTARLAVQRSAATPASVPMRHFELRSMRMDDYFALVILRDTTDEVAEHKRLLEAEARIHDSKKRESLTLLAAGIAHDMKNVLSIVLNAAESRDADPSGDSARTLLTIRESVRRGAAMMRELQTYAGVNRIKLLRLSPTMILEDIKLLTNRVVGDNVLIDYRPASDAPDVDADPNQFWKVVFNIVKNAGEAIGPHRPGQIVISTSRATMTEALAEKFISERPLPAGPGALFTISDDGPGVSAELLPRLFDPYVSSKAEGRGLGLATVRTIVEAHGGGIRVLSALERGTTFEIFLPESRQAVRSVTESAPAQSPTRELSGEVLLVDDDASIRRTTSILLKALKLTPFLAKDQSEALSFVRRQADSLQAIILDAELGGMDTVRLLSSFRRMAPHVPVILSTGSAEEQIRERYAEANYDFFLGKPYTLAELRAAIAAVSRR